MDECMCLLTVWRSLATVLTRNRTITITTPSSTTSETSLELSWERIQDEFDHLGEYDLHNILRRPNKVGWCEWHLDIDKTVNVIKTADRFHKDFEKLALSTSLGGTIDIIENTFLKFMPTNKELETIRTYFARARDDDDPLLILKAYTVDQLFTRRLNKYLAVNTHHTLKLHCTLLNCPILVRTQDFTEAFTSILFHPELTEYLVRQIKVYRGCILDDEKLVASYKEGATIITTTFLSTSTNRVVAERWCDTPFKDKISIFCTYNISNTHRRTALDLRKLSHFEDEEEILILRYVPFTITSLKPIDGRRMEICFDECKDH